MASWFTCLDSAFAWAVIGYLCSPNPPQSVCVGAGALIPEKGGALRKQSTVGRRFGVAALLCGALLGLPLLLLHTQTPHAARVSRDAASVRTLHVARRGWGLDLPTHLVAYRAPATATATTTTTTLPATTTTTVPPTTTT